MVDLTRDGASPVIENSDLVRAIVEPVAVDAARVRRTRLVKIARDSQLLVIKVLYPVDQSHFLPHL